MPLTPWTGFTRGLLLGIGGGLAIGCAEGLQILNSAPAGRSGVLEALVYAMVVDALGFGAFLGTLGAVAAPLFRGTFQRLSPRSVAALYVSGAAGATFLLARAVLAFPPRGVEREGAMSPVEWLLFPLAALGLALALYPVARTLAWPLLASTRRTAIAAISAYGLLGLVLPFEALREGTTYVELARTSAAEVDLGVLSPDLTAGLEERFEEALALGGEFGGEARPNVLLITVDALRADHVGACGNPWIQTPSMDLLARHGALSCDTYPQQPQSNPALASLLTSTYPAVHGVRMHMVDRLPDSFDTLAEILARHGYATAAILPWPALEPAFSGFHQGFDVYETYVVNAPPTLENPLTASLGALYRRVTDQVALGGALEAVLALREQVEEEIDGRADVTAAAAIQWLSERRRSPFFLWVHFFDPHYPWTAPEPWDQLYDEGYSGRYDGSMGFVFEMREGIFDPDPRDVEYLRHLYASEISYADHHVGQLLGHAAQLGLLENTVILLTGDHGESLGERGGSWPEGEYWLHGDDLYSPGIRVPLMLYDPRWVPEPRMLTAPLQHVDLMPTVLDLVGIPIPTQAQGRSLVPLLDGRDEGRDRVAITILPDDRASSIVSAEGWKLIVDHWSRTQELYYLPGDPDERIDLARALPTRANALAARLSEWGRANGRIVVERQPNGVGG